VGAAIILADLVMAFGTVKSFSRDRGFGFKRAPLDRAIRSQNFQGAGTGSLRTVALRCR
jgi:cold shock CspA family protein